MGMHKIHSLLRETSEAENSDPKPWFTLPPRNFSNQFCDICLRRFSLETERYQCEHFDICRFCPPAETNSCPVCGNQLVKSIVLPPTTTEDPCAVKGNFSYCISSMLKDYTLTSNCDNVFRLLYPPRLQPPPHSPSSPPPPPPKNPPNQFLNSSNLPAR